jgi:hypothetical protein
VAANLGLEQLTATLGQIEKLCGSPHDGGTLNTELTRAQRTLTAQLDAALSAIHAAVAAGGTAGADAAAGASAGAGGAAVADVKTYDPAAAHQKAADLLPSLQRGALDDAKLTGLASSLSGAPAAQTQQLAELQNALNDFDFPLAQGALQELLASLAAENP